MTDEDALFRPDGDAFVPLPMARGPWHPQSLNGTADPGRRRDLPLGRQGHGARALDHALRPRRRGVRLRQLATCVALAQSPALTQR